MLVLLYMLRYNKYKHKKMDTELSNLEQQVKNNTSKLWLNQTPPLPLTYMYIVVYRYVYTVIYNTSHWHGEVRVGLVVVEDIPD